MLLSSALLGWVHALPYRRHAVHHVPVLDGNPGIAHAQVYQEEQKTPVLMFNPLGQWMLMVSMPLIRGPNFHHSLRTLLQAWSDCWWFVGVGWVYYSFNYLPTDNSGVSHYIPCSDQHLLINAYHCNEHHPGKATNPVMSTHCYCNGDICTLPCNGEDYLQYNHAVIIIHWWLSL